MAATVLYMSMSLDGFIAGPNVDPTTASATAASGCTGGSSPAPRAATSTLPSRGCAG